MMLPCIAPGHEIYLQMSCRANSARLGRTQIRTASYEVFLSFLSCAEIG